MKRRRLEIAAAHLGPVDGLASARTLELVHSFIDSFEAARSEDASTLRERLSATRPPRRLGRRINMRLSTAGEMVRRSVGR